MFWDRISSLYDLFENAASLGVKFVELLGAEFKLQFDLESYKKFFARNGYENVKYHVVDGRMPCAIAVINK